MSDINVPHMTRQNIDSVTSMMNSFIDLATQMRASDIHIDPKIDEVQVRFRIDGMMTLNSTLEKVLLPEIIGRIKIMAGLRGDVHDKSQDGRFFREVKDNRVDIRVSIAPTYYGENIVMRLLMGQSRAEDLAALGFSCEQESIILDSLKKTQGMIVVCGPTGAGKTNSLYAMLRHVSPGSRSVVSLEDPVEYPLRDVRQIQLKPSIGFGFHQALRGVLRQDPDVIMIGEMRDRETAAVAVQVALTGHLVITSIHAEDAAHIVPRLIDMGIDPYLLAATLRVMVGQRLVRKYDIEKREYRGRTGIFEVMQVNDELRDGILERATAQRIEEISSRNGFRNMREDGMQKVSLGITTVEEVKRVLQ